MKIKELLSDESKWTQDAVARDGKGNKCVSTDHQAICWCITGAVHKCYYPYEDKIIRKIVDKTMSEYDQNIITWNDDPDRTFEEVRQLVEELDI